MIMKRYFFLLIALAIIFSSCKKDENDEENPDDNPLAWTLFDGVMSNHAGGALALTPDNNVMVAGILNTNYQIYKTNIAFEQTWQKNKGQAAFEEANAIAITDDNACIIAGNSSVGLQSQIYILKLDASGNEIWEGNYGWMDVNVCNGICVSNDQLSYVICGQGQNTSKKMAFSDIMAMKIDMSGDTIWYRTYEDIGEELAYAVTSTSDGGFVITGRDENNNNKDLALIKIDADGKLEWFRFFGGNTWEEGFYVTEDSQGNFVACGISQGNYSNVYVVKASSSGSLIWEYTYGQSDKNEKGYCIQEASDGYIISGSQYIIENIDDDIYILKIDKDGEYIWQAVYGGSASDYGNAVRILNDGSLILAGTTRSNSDAGNIFLMKADANGNLQ
jgi:hypothetical protein